MRLYQQIPPLEWNAREVVRELGDRAYLLARIEVRGAFFPHRNAPPFIRIRSRRRTPDLAWFTEVAEDERGLVGYFPLDLPRSGVIEVGYGAEVWAQVPTRFSPERLELLVRERLPKGVVETKRSTVARIRRGAGPR